MDARACSPARSPVAFSLKHKFVAPQVRRLLLLLSATCWTSLAIPQEALTQSWQSDPPYPDTSPHTRTTDPSNPNATTPNGTGAYDTNYDTSNYGTSGYGTNDDSTRGYGAAEYDSNNYGTRSYGTNGYGTGEYGTGEYGTGEYGTGEYGQEEAVPEDAAGEICRPRRSLPVELTSFTNGLLPALNRVANPESLIASVIEHIGPQVLAFAKARPFPEIHDRAKQAKVPVMMYHDILPEKEVFFDVTPEELEEDFRLIRENGLTPIHLEQLVQHLKTGMPLPEKPILLTFDDGYGGHYEHVYPLLKKYGYPAVFSIYTAKIDGKVVGRSSMTWDQVREVAQDPLITIASHSVTHPRNLTQLFNEELMVEVVQSKQDLETNLGIPIRYFTYPEGHYDARVLEWVQKAGYEAALTMSNYYEDFSGASESLLAINRFGQSSLEDVVSQVWGGAPLPRWDGGFDFNAPVAMNRTTIEEVPIILISGGKPVTIHANSRYQVPEILAGTEAIAGVDGGFFSMKYLDSNVMIGPVLGQNTGQFVPGNDGENVKLTNRPLVLISPTAVRFIPFQPDRHNTLAGIQTELPDVTDAFVGAAFLVRGGEPQPPESFGDLFDFDAARHRAFWGINWAGQPVVGVSTEPVGSVDLGRILAAAGFRDAVMLDSGASTSLAYQGESLVAYTPRPVPHVVGLVPPTLAQQGCATVASQPREVERKDNF